MKLSLYGVASYHDFMTFHISPICCTHWKECGHNARSASFFLLPGQVFYESKVATWGSPWPRQLPPCHITLSTMCGFQIITAGEKVSYRVTPPKFTSQVASPLNPVLTLTLKSFMVCFWKRSVACPFVPFPWKCYFTKISVAMSHEMAVTIFWRRQNFLWGWGRTDFPEMTSNLAEPHGNPCALFHLWISSFLSRAVDQFSSQTIGVAGEMLRGGAWHLHLSLWKTPYVWFVDLLCVCFLSCCFSCYFAAWSVIRQPDERHIHLM